MSIENPLWGAPRIHGELLKLGFEVAQSSVAKSLKAQHWFLWVCCPACRTTQAVDLRTLDRHPWSALTGLIPALSCRSCRPHAPFAELVRLSKTSVADEIRKERARQSNGG
jgi:hypothetical protein